MAEISRLRDTCPRARAEYLPAAHGHAVSRTGKPHLQAEPQEITVLQAGKAPGGAGSDDGVETSGSGANGNTESDLQGDVEQPDPNEADNEAGQDTEPETVPQEQPTQPDYSEASIGTNTDSNQGNDGEEAGETGEADEDLPLTPLDLGAALTWYKVRLGTDIHRLRPGAVCRQACSARAARQRIPAVQPRPHRP